MPATDSTQRSDHLSAIIQQHPRSNATARTDRHRIQRKTLHPCPCHRDTFFEQAHHAFPHHAIHAQAPAARRASEAELAIFTQQTPSQALEAQKTCIHCQRLTPVSNAQQMPLARGIDPTASRLRLCVEGGKHRQKPIARHALHHGNHRAFQPPVNALHAIAAIRAKHHARSARNDRQSVESRKSIARMRKHTQHATRPRAPRTAAMRRRRRTGTARSTAETRRARAPARRPPCRGPARARDERALRAPGRARGDPGAAS